MKQFKQTFLFVCLLVVGCATQPPPAPEVPERSEQPEEAIVTRGVPRAAGKKTHLAPISIATWNIENLGPATLRVPGKLDQIAAQIAKHDIVAVQEISDRKGEIFPALMVVVKKIEPNYDSILGERVGEGGKAEQYAFIFRKDRVVVKDNASYVGRARSTFSRTPLFASFKVRQGNFDFILITTHTSPPTAAQEIDALATVVEDLKSKFPREKDFIVLGDLNAGCNYFNKKKREGNALLSDKYVWFVKDDAQTTDAKKSCAHDRIIGTTTVVEDYTGTAGVARPVRSPSANVIQLSDHFMVYALFYTDRDTD